MPIDRNNAQYITGAIYKPTQTSAPGVWDLDDQANNTAKNLWPLPPQAVQRSLRFNSADSAYLNRTPAVAGSRTTWTWSAWVKRAGLYTTNAGPTLFDVGPDNGNFMFIRFNSDTQDVIDFGWTVSGSVVCRIRSTASFRDSSAWYHIVAVLDTTNATSTDRMRLYVNGQRLTSFGVTTYPAQNTATCYVNATNIHYLGRSVEPLYRYMDGYISEVNLIDGQALDATSFGETDPQTGVWIPKRYTGTYGTNGFRLSFANNSSTTALGYDSSGQGNNWTTNNFSVTPGVNNDVFVDVPSMYNTDTGLGGEVIGNYATFNSLVASQTGSTLSNGNLDVVTPTTGTGKTNYGEVTATIGVSSGKWYWEVLTVAFSGTKSHVIGIDSDANASGTNGLIEAGNRYSYASFNGNKYSGATGSSYGATYDIGDIVGVALDLDSGSITFYKNGVSQGVAFTGLSGAYYPAISDTGGGNVTLTANFGQRPFAYAAPTGFKALCTTNLPAPAIGQTSSNQADNHFNVVTYTGNGGTQTISTLDFQPDLVWIKRRDSNWSHAVYDSIRGAGSLKALSTNATDAESVFNADTTYGYLSSFNNNGFTVVNGSTGGYTNLNNATYVAWCWNAGGTTVTNTSGTITSQVRANRAAGFSVMTYTGNGVSYPTGATVGHGLATAPQFIIAKSRDAAGSWNCYHVSVATGNRIDLNSTAAATGDAGVWNSVAPTSTVFSIGNTGNSNISGRTYVAYCFAAVPGFSAFGSYTGNGSSDGPFVYLGFRPRWLLIKNITFSPTNWILQDTARSPNNVSGNLLLPDSSSAEILNSSADYIDILSNGFKVRNSGDSYNRSSSTIIYAAFAETPARLSTAR